MPWLADTHCHLDFAAFEGERPHVVERARQAGVKYILNPGTDLKSSQEAVRLAQEFSEVYAAIGVHPNDSLNWTVDTPQALRQLARQAGSKVVAVGEIGLDYYRDRAPRDIQQQAFRQQLELAAELELPVVIHNRQAGADVLAILAEWCRALAGSASSLQNRAGVLHSFSEDEAAAQEAIELGFSIGITGPVTFKNASDLQRVVASLPLDRLLVETDAPFLTPHPHRGQRNEPAYVRLVAEKIASLHQLPFPSVIEQTTENARRLFNW